MASFYNSAAGGPAADGGGTPQMYNVEGWPGSGGTYGQQSEQSQQVAANASKWQNPVLTQQSQNAQSVLYGQASQQQLPGQSSFFAGMQRQGTQVASQIVADFTTGNLTGEKIGEKLMDGIGKGFGGGIPGLEYVMESLRGYFAVDNRYVKRKMVKVLFPFLNNQWRRSVSCFFTLESGLFSHSLFLLWPFVAIRRPRNEQLCSTSFG
jgi:hypothetical protein